jgi:oxalate decarboxylase/phosphoglucose isomerase-like protein (cupin superfamily)
MSISECNMVDFPIIEDARGKLAFIESEHHLPFKIERVYYLYDVPRGASRAGHAHKALQQVLVAISGSFNVLLDDGRQKMRHQLNQPCHGLYIPSGIWRELDNFSPGAVCLSMVSEHFDESDYIRDYFEFLQTLGGGKNEGSIS